MKMWIQRQQQEKHQQVKSNYAVEWLPQHLKCTQQLLEVSQ